jgi:uncharacterized protein YjbJ (UPF0337 family)
VLAPARPGTTGAAQKSLRQQAEAEPEEIPTMRIPRVDPKDATGLFDKLVGLGKEIVGEVFDETRLIEAGEAQQAKGTEKLKAIREQAKADAHQAKARSYDAKERTAQAAKS